MGETVLEPPCRLAKAHLGHIGAESEVRRGSRRIRRIRGNKARDGWEQWPAGSLLLSFSASASGNPQGAGPLLRLGENCDKVVGLTRRHYRHADLGVRGAEYGAAVRVVGGRFVHPPVHGPLGRVPRDRDL
jgi:hypothetical protein